MYRSVLGSPVAQRNVVLVLLLGMAAASWALLLLHGGRTDPGMPMASSTMGLSAPAFLAMWVVMMVAMMFPPAAPMIMTFNRIQSGRRERGEGFVSTWLFVGGYLLIWSLAGVAAYLGALAAEAIAARWELSAAACARIAGVLLVAAGIYQLTPLKKICLSKCRSPIGFILSSWRDGARGALRMGLVHGLYCLGCCWLLFLILFPLGIMNIAAMALLTLVVFAEKSLAWERAAVYGTSAALIAYGLVVIAVPRALPSFAASPPGTNMPGMTMPGMSRPAGR